MFVGREEELRVLGNALDALFAGRGGAFLLAGEPGIGKTRLADEVVRRATERGAVAAWGSAWDGGGAPAYWPWIQVIRALRSRVPEPNERLRRDLGPMWDDGGSGDVAASDEHVLDHELLRFRRFDALRAVLAVASSRTPLVLVLDDLHAADRASLLALHFVTRALRSMPVLVIGTHRDAEVRLDAGLGEVLARVAREGRSLLLRRLSRDHVARWMTELDSVPDRLVDEIHRRSGGNPLFVGETLRVVRSGGRAQDVPDGVVAIIHERLARFGLGSREVLEAFAVLGREVAWPVLADVSATTIVETRELLRAPTLAGVVEDVGPDRVSFSHALFREGLYRELAHDRREALHLRAGRALARARAAGHDAAEESIALHLVAALPAGDADEAVRWALRAGESAMRQLAFDRAVTMLDGAKVALQRLASDPVRRIDIDLSLAEALARSGNTERARALCIAAADEARVQRDGARLARAALVYGAELRIAMVDAELVGLLQEALAMLDEGENALRARVMARLAAAQQPSATPEIPVRQARDAVALARSSGDPATLLDTIYMAGSALADYAPPEERLLLARELVSLATPRGDLVRAQQGHVRAAIDLLELYDLASADVAIAAHVRLGDAMGHPRWRWRGVLMQAMRSMMHGRWAEVVDAHERVAAMASSADDPNLMTALTFSRLGLLRTRQSGDATAFERAWDPVIEGLAQADIVGPLARAGVLARLGDDEAARRWIATTPLTRAHWAADPVVLLIMAEVAVAARDRARAAEMMPALAAVKGRGLSWGVSGLVWEGPSEHWLGTALALLGRRDEAVTALDDALAVADALDTDPLRARVSLDLASVLFERGGASDVERARRLLDDAATIADELGMTAITRRVDALRDAVPALTPTLSPFGERGPGPGARSPSFTLTRQGDVWIVEHAGRSTFVKHSRGVEILDELVRQPGREVHVLDLGGTEAGQTIDAGHAGELLDATAKQAYRQRIVDLREELEEASAWSDAGRSERLRAELEVLTDELSRGVGLGGRDRRAGAAVERARVNVQKRLRGVVRKIAEGLPELGRHLELAVHTGTFVSYRPET